MRELSIAGITNFIVGAVMLIIGISLLAINQYSDSMNFNVPIVIAFLSLGVALLLVSFFFKKTKKH